MLSFFGIAFAVGAGSLLFAYCGMIAAKEAIHSKDSAIRALSLDTPQFLRKKTGVSGLLLFAIGVLPLASLTQADAQSGPTTGLAAAAQVSNPAEISQASTTAPAEPRSSSLPSPAMTGPLRMAAPVVFDAGPFGSLAITGILSGFGYWQGHPAKSDHAASANLSNGAIFAQRTNGLVQFFVQAGVYSLPALGSPVSSATMAVENYFGPLPVLYLKISPTEKFSLLIGKLPTLMGMENTFTFQNFNVERGLLWSQTNAITRGGQMNYTGTKLSSSISWNDGFYSNRYNWLTGSEAYTIDKTGTLALSAGGNLGSTGYSTTTTPLYQNNSDFLDLAYTYTAKQWLIQPYLQYTRVGSSQRMNLKQTTVTVGGALFANYTINPQFSMAGRVEYLGNSGNPGDSAANLVYGAGSRAWSLTLTPTYQDHSLFARAELSFVQAIDAVRGDAFGTNGSNTTQTRFMIETGVVF